MPRVYIFVIYMFIPLKRCQPNVFNQSSSNCKSCVRTGFTNSHLTGSTSVRNRYATAQVGVVYFKWPGYIQSNTAKLWHVELYAPNRWFVAWKFQCSWITFLTKSKIYSISQEICTRFLLCCALLWLYIDWFTHIHQAYFTGTVAV